MIKVWTLLHVKHKLCVDGLVPEGAAADAAELASYGWSKEHGKEEAGGGGKEHCCMLTAGFLLMCSVLQVLLRGCSVRARLVTA
jgi:hypothetical protein